MYSNYTFEIRKLNNKIKMKEKYKMSNIFEKKVRINELTNLRKELMQQGNVVEEVKVLKDLAELTQEVFGEESDENIKILNEVGGTLKYVGKFDTAKDALLKAQGFIEKKYGKDSIPYATCSLNLAEVYRFMKIIIYRMTMFMRVYAIIWLYFIKSLKDTRKRLNCRKKVWRYWKKLEKILFSMQLR